MRVGRSFEIKSRVTKNLIRRMNKRITSQRVKNDFMHAIQLKLHEQKANLSECDTIRSKKNLEDEKNFRFSNN